LHAVSRVQQAATPQAAASAGSFPMWPGYPVFPQYGQFAGYQPFLPPPYNMKYMMMTYPVDSEQMIDPAYGLFMAVLHSL